VPVAVDDQISIDNAIRSYASGAPVIIADTTRENEADFAIRASACTPEIVNLFLSRGRGVLCLVLSESRAGEMGVSRLKTNGNDPFGTPFGMPLSVADGSTSVSVEARSRTIRRVSGMKTGDPSLILPGHVQTLVAHPDLSRGRRGHTETVLELAELAGVEDDAVLCEILDDQGRMADMTQIRALAEELGIVTVRLDQILDYLDQKHLRGAPISTPKRAFNEQVSE